MTRRLDPPADDTNDIDEDDAAQLERGLIVNRTAENVVRRLPPDVITEAEIADAIARLDAALTAVEGA